MSRSKWIFASLIAACMVRPARCDLAGELLLRLLVELPLEAGMDALAGRIGGKGDKEVYRTYCLDSIRLYQEKDTLVFYDATAYVDKKGNKAFLGSGRGAQPGVIEKSDSIVVAAGGKVYKFIKYDDVWYHAADPGRISLATRFPFDAGLHYYLAGGKAWPSSRFFDLRPFFSRDSLSYTIFREAAYYKSKKWMTAGTGLLVSTLFTLTMFRYDNDAMKAGVIMAPLVVAFPLMVVFDRKQKACERRAITAYNRKR